ncbi:MAG: FkbM family methyltransferase [Patescibacteria group bacterium]
MPDRYSDLHNKIEILQQTIKSRDESIGHLQFQLDTVLTTKRWKIASALAHLYHYIFDNAIPITRDRQDYHFNPYEYVKQFKDIAVVALATKYKPLQIKSPFSTATTIYNEGKDIQLFLQSIEAQSLWPNEVILVDGGSTDNTIKIVETFARTSKLPIRLIKGNHLNIPAGRNLAIQSCQNEIIVLADAGTRLHENYFSNLLGALLEHPDADLVGGIYHAQHKSRFSQYFVPDWQQVDWKTFLPSTRSMLLKKSLALAAGLYPEYLQTGDDTLFDINYRRLSYKWVFNQEAIVLWDSPNSQAQSTKLLHSYGFGDGRSGVGDFSFYHSPTSVPERMEYYQGYLKGKAERANLEISKRKIRGLFIIVADLPIHDKGSIFNLWFVKSCLGYGYKVVYVNLFSRTHPDAYKSYLDLDYTLLELYGIDNFDIKEILHRYHAITQRIFLLQRSSAILSPEIESALKIYPEIKVGHSLLVNRLFLLIQAFTHDNSSNIENYYVPALDCQIPGLSGIYERVLGRKRDGYFVEIGAYDGSAISNTAFLADTGWRGVYVEPVPKYAAMCKKRHLQNNVKVCAVGIGAKKLKVKVNIGGDISTTLEDPQEFYTSIGFPDEAKKHTGKSVMVDQVPLEDLLIKEGVPPHFDLLVLDTEGTEWEILKVFNIARWKPTLVIVEMHEKSVDWNKADLVRSSNAKINQYFQQAGYAKIYSDDINSIFLNKKH